MINDESTPLRRAYEGLGPRGVARLFEGSPKQTRSGLEMLLEQNPDAFAEIVPQPIDQQTGLFSKVYFEKVLLPKSIQKAESQAIPISYLIFDLDNFHDFNGAYGLAKGDRAIAEFSQLLKQNFRTANRRRDNILEEERTGKDRRNKEINSLDVIARTPDYMAPGRVGGGEEFAVILDGCDEKTAEYLANRFLEKVRQIQIMYRDQKIGIGASVGVAQYQNGMAPDGLKKNANLALNYAKDNGKGRAMSFSNVPADYTPKIRERK